MRVLVCGGRDYKDAARVAQVLDTLHAQHGFTVVIEGGALGVDSWAALWAQGRGIAGETYPADWTAYGKAAGPIRNLQMISNGKPDLVVAFPGGRGTADMVRRAKTAGIKVIEVPPAPREGRE